MFLACFRQRDSITFACAFLHEYQLYITQLLRPQGVRHNERILNAQAVIRLN